MASKKTERPLSPHLFIYKPMLSMTLSVIHRATGMAMYFGTLVVAWWFMSMAMGAEAYEFFAWVMGSWVGMIVLVGFTWVLFHHMFGGIKHFFWDFGKGFELETVEHVAKLAVVVPVCATIIVWAFGLMLTSGGAL
ncbi:MAG: succinate dehydrogenase, cytochrome b556 subunit [Alphaproteobacteria bacterium]|nr:succinate dehydrogenase, cytochrome b556 subunit [Alphaproteobacteria bacterium]